MAKGSQTPPVSSCGCQSPMNNGWFINSKKNWQLGSWDSGVSAEGKDAPIPYIGGNDNWWIDGVDTGKPSKGRDGVDGDRGARWFSVLSTTEAPPTDSKIDDLIINGSDSPIDIGATSPVPAGGFVKVLGLSPFEVTEVEGVIQGAKGNDGEGEVGPPGSSIEERYAVNGSITVPPTLDATSRNPAGWSTTIPTATPVQYVWKTVAYISHTNALVGVWGAPQRVTGAPGTDGENGTGPGVMIRGDWSNTAQYNGSAIKIEAVKYSGQGYLTRYDAGEIPIGNLPTDTAYWNGPFPNVDAIFTDTLVAYQAYIEDLTVGAIRTNIEEERTVIGRQPTNVLDPTRTYSRHGIRFYTNDMYPDFYLGKNGVSESVLESYYVPFGETTPIKRFELNQSRGDLIFYDFLDSSNTESFIVSKQGISSTYGKSIVLTNSSLSSSTDGYRYFAVNGTNAYTQIRKVTKSTNSFDRNYSCLLLEHYDVDDPSILYKALDVSKGKVILPKASNSITVSDGGSSSGDLTGYTGVINGARYVNGICVGPE